ncbi:unnamed protein product, partial [marine sediment metagenome]
RFIYTSDHGQTESIPFKDYFRETLTDFIKKSLNDPGIEIIEGGELKYKEVVNQIEYVIRAAIGDVLWSRIFHGFYKMIVRKYCKTDYSMPPKESIIIMPQGDIAHIYFNIKKKKMLYEEIKKFYPKLLNTFLSHKGVRFLALSSKNGPIMLTKDEMVLLNEKDRAYREGFPFPVFNQDFLLDSIKEIVEMKNSGDIILFGSKIKGKVISFLPDGRGIHGGIEKDEQEIFIISPVSCSSSIEGVRTPKELYSIFIKYVKPKQRLEKSL